MSRGHGHIEGAILDCLGRCQDACTDQIARYITDGSSGNRSLRSSINRGLRNLCEAGLVVEVVCIGNVKWFALTEIAQKADRKKKAQERLDERKREAAGKAYVEWLSEVMGAAAEKRTDGRRTLAKMLGMLGSEHPGERDAAALQIEALRRKMGKTWAQILDVEDDEDKP